MKANLLYPIAIVELADRWMAIANYWDVEREDYIFDPEHHYEDIRYEDWIGIGDTPQEAYDDLRRKNGIEFL